MLHRLLIITFVLLARVPSVSAQFQFEVVHGFSTATGGRTPSAPLLETSDGSLYGTTVNGGAGDVGVVFQLLPDRSIVTRDLQGATSGQHPYGGLVQTPDGTLYGTTKNGGANSSGTFFTITPSGTFVTYDLPGAFTTCGGAKPAVGPTAGLTIAPDGNLYGTVPGDIFFICNSYGGALFRLTPQGTFAKVADVSGTRDVLVAGPGGLLYGGAMPAVFTPSNAFTFSTPGQLTVLHEFTTAEGTRPNAFVVAADGNLYATAMSGGATDRGTVFRMTPAGSVTVLHNFQGTSDGSAPLGALVLAGDGNLYGVTSRGGAFDAGTIFRISLTGVFDVVYTFTGGADGGQPLAALIQGSDGALYGTASTGGPDGGGAVFRIKSLATEPLIMIDIPGAGATVGPSFEVAGWTIDRGAFTGTGIDAVHVYAFPNPGSGAAPIFLGVATQGISRPDVGAIYGSRFAPSGYSVTSPVLAPGSYLIAAIGRSSVTGAFSAVATRNVTVVPPQSLPFIALDVPAPNATVTGPIAVSGWAIDAAAVTGTGVDTVHVWAVPETGGAAIFVGVATYGLSRPDVGAIIGSQFTNCGYQITGSLPQGRYTIAAFGWSTVAGAFNSMRLATNVTVQ